MMKIKHKFTIEDVTSLNDFFKSMLDTTNSKVFQQLGIHHTYITFLYLIGDSEISNGHNMKLPMVIFLVETNTKTTFCLVEQFANKFFQIEDTDKFSDINTDLIFVDQEESKHVGICFDSLEQLDAAVQRILEYTALLIFDDLSKQAKLRH